MNRTHTGHRITDAGLVEESFAITVTEVETAEAPLIYRVTGDDGEVVPVHTFDGKLWSPCDQDAASHRHMMLENQITRYKTSADYRTAVQETFDRYLIIDGILHTQVAAPVYEMICSPYSKSCTIWAVADPHPIVSASPGTYAPHEADLIRQRNARMTDFDSDYVEQKLNLIERF